MKRLYFLVPTIDATSSIVEELRRAGIPDQDIYVVGKDHHRLQLAHLHEAGILQTTGLLFALKRGLIIGAIIGAISGYIASQVVPEIMASEISMIIALGLFGAAVGAWSSTLIGSSTPNPRVWKYELQIKSGKLLMLIDVPKEKESEIMSLIKLHHPEAIIDAFDAPKNKKKQKSVRARD